MKTIISLAFSVLLLSAVSTFAQAQHAGHGPHGASAKLKAPNWTYNPILIATGRYSRKGATYQAFNMHAMEADYVVSFHDRDDDDLNAATYKMNIEDSGKVSLKMEEDGGYYLVRVIGHGPEGEEAIASTFKYFSKPGPAPRDLLNAKRPGFEIVPAILPREHSRFRENQTWPFRVRLNGNPVSHATVLLETSNKSKLEFITDDDGVAQVTLPDDFPDIPKDQWSHGRPPASKFVLSVRDGALLATFNGDYSLDAYGNKNLWAGVGFAVLGMVVAVPLVRRRKQS